MGGGELPKCLQVLTPSPAFLKKLKMAMLSSLSLYISISIYSIFLWHLDTEIWNIYSLMILTWWYISTYLDGSVLWQSPLYVVVAFGSELNQIFATRLQENMR